MGEASDFYTAEIDLKDDETASSLADTERSRLVRSDSQGSAPIMEDLKGEARAARNY